MWSSYHTLHTSERYLTEWRLFLQKCGISEVSLMFCQYVGHHVFKQLIIPWDKVQGSLLSSCVGALAVVRVCSPFECLERRHGSCPLLMFSTPTYPERLGVLGELKDVRVIMDPPLCR